MKGFPHIIAEALITSEAVSKTSRFDAWLIGLASTDQKSALQQDLMSFFFVFFLHKCQNFISFRAREALSGDSIVSNRIGGWKRRADSLEGLFFVRFCLKMSTSPVDLETQWDYFQQSLYPRMQNLLYYSFILLI
jgi:hypothetical protein